jgi:hypothetical protein
MLGKMLSRIAGNPSIPSPERERVLDYYKESLRITGLQEREADRYNSALLMHMNSLDRRESAQAMVEASRRLALAAKECIRRHAEASHVPDEAAADYAAWSLLYQDYSAWADAQHDAFVAISAGLDPAAARVADLMAESERQRARAERETAALCRRLGLKARDVQTLMATGIRAKEAAQWEPSQENFTALPSEAAPPSIALETSAITTALVAAEPIYQAWTSLTGEDPISIKSHFVVRMELLWYVLHYVNRVAFTAAGPEARARVQDSIAVRAVNSMIASSFDTKAAAGIDVERWRLEMMDGAVDSLNDAELEYGSCPDFVANLSAGESVLDYETATGRLAGRIASEVGQFGNVQLRLLVAQSAMKALGASGITERVKEACGRF